MQRLYRFLAVKDKNAATRAIKTIRSSLQILTDQPQMGRGIKDMDSEFREWSIDFGNSGYVAMYRYDTKNAIILSVRHQKEVGY